MSVTAGICAFSENIQIMLLGKLVVPELMHRRKFKLLTKIYHIQILRIESYFPERIELQTQFTQVRRPELIGQLVPRRS